MTNDPAVLTFDGTAVRMTIDLRTYRLSAVKKAAYRMADRFTAILGTIADEQLPIVFTFKPGVAEANVLKAVRLFFQELLDQDLREHVADETAPMRTLILAQAFSKTDLIRRE